MMGITIGSMIGSDTLTGFIAPVVDLPPAAQAAALGAFICGVSGVVIARVLGNPRNSTSEKSVLERNAATIPADPKIVRLADFRKAA